MKATEGFRILVKARGRTRAQNKGKRIEKGTPPIKTEEISYALGDGNGEVGIL
jgi:hypothetical protein